ncbi:hypothetical protein BDZ97DRAFT_1929728 [Flammula alnicola]|nr:hypothetical protein BDZ97DRAFT_1929728 [Flammula alnicola]
MASTSTDHFELICGFVKSTAQAIFISHHPSNTHPSAAEIRSAIDTIHGCLTQHANNHFLHSTCLAPDYVYVGDPGEDEDKDAEGSNDSDSSNEPPASSKVGPPAKWQHTDNSASAVCRHAASSPAPSVSTCSHSQLKTASNTQAVLPFKANAAPVTISASSRTCNTSTRVTSPVAKAASSTLKICKAPSVLELSEDDEVDELEDDFQPALKASLWKGKGKSKSTKPPKLLPREVAFTMEERQQNPGHCLACATHLFKEEPCQCKFFGWGKCCRSGQTGGKSRCTFELKPGELDEVLESITLLVLSSRDHLHSLIILIERYLQDVTMFSQLANCANRNASSLLMQLLERAQYLKTNFPPGISLAPASRILMFWMHCFLATGKFPVLS